MFGVGPALLARRPVAVRAVAVPGALVQMRITTALGYGVGRMVGLDRGGEHRARPRHLHREHGRPLPRLHGQGCSTAARARRRRLAGARGPRHACSSCCCCRRAAATGAAPPLGLTLARPRRSSGSCSSGCPRHPVGAAEDRAHAARASCSCSSPSPCPSASRSPRPMFGVSIALGAFLAGIVVGESPLSHQVGADVLPFREAFAVLFFVSVGMLVDPRDLSPTPATWPCSPRSSCWARGWSRSASRCCCASPRSPRWWWRRAWPRSASSRSSSARPRCGCT